MSLLLVVKLRWLYFCRGLVNFYTVFFYALRVVFACL